MDPTSELKCSTSSETTTTDGNDAVALDHGKDDNPEEGTRRYYECTFCKRGFTNAQALGGHMNIHRKDRVKLTNNHNHRGHHVVMNPKTSSSTTEDACYNELPKPSVCRDHHDKCGFQASSEINFLEIRSDFGETSCFYGVLDANYLTLRVGSSHPLSSHGQCYCNTTAMKSTTRTTNGNNIKEDQEELDLELRLGHF